MKLTKSFAAIVLIMAIFLLYSCGDSNESASSEQQSIDPNAKLTFEVVETLEIDYLGNLSLVDLSPDASKFLLIDNQRGIFLVTDRQGNFLHQFEKKGDRPDFPGRIQTPPFFLDDNYIALISARALYIYDLDGELTQLIRDESPLSGGMMMMVMTMNPGKEAYRAVWGNQLRAIKKGSPIPPNFQTNEGPDLSANRAIEVITPDAGTFEKWIGFESDSKFMSGDTYPTLAMSPVIGIGADGKVYLAYNQDPTIRVYEYRNGELVLTQSIPMNPEVFNFMKPIVPGEGGMPGAIFMPAAIGAGSVRFIHGHENEIITMYNPGLPEEEQAKPEVNQSGGNVEIRIQSPKDLPKNRFQYFLNGQKVGNDFEAPDMLKSIVLAEGPHLWFSRDTEKDEEESDFITFYKVKVVEKK
jgi:hypothetical protein